MKIIYNNIIPFKGFAAINLFGILFVRNGITVTDEMINHEKIHTAQIRELGFIFFYIWYAIEWLIKIIGYGTDAYYNISFESEAYTNERNLNYLQTRKHYSFLKYF